MFPKVVIRLDDRFIHGQIILSWLKALQANRIVIIDKEMMEDPFMYTLFQLALPEDICFEIVDCQQGVNYIKQHADQAILVLLRSLDVLEELYDEGIAFNEVMIGRIPFKGMRKKRCEDVYLTKEENQVIEKLLRLGVEIAVQMVPDSERYCLKPEEEGETFGND